MRWQEAIQQASNGGMAFRIEESVDHMAAIWPADGVVFVSDEDLSTTCCLRTQLRSEQLVERLLEEFAISLTDWKVHYSTQDLEERELSGSFRGVRKRGSKGSVGSDVSSPKALILTWGQAYPELKG